MGQKMHPHGLRVGVIKDWNSKWYADSKILQIISRRSQNPWICKEKIIC